MRSLAAALALAALSFAAPVAAQPLASARLVLDHRMQDQLTFEVVHLEVDVTLERGTGDAVALRLVGTRRSHRATLHPGGGSEATEPAERPFEARWTGTLRRDGADLEIHFDDGGMAVDVTWRCEVDPVTVGGRRVRAWRCSTPQARTRPSGPAQPLPIYLQIPLRLAPPAARLSVHVQARGGADHRSTIESERFPPDGRTRKAPREKVASAGSPKAYSNSSATRHANPGRTSPPSSVSSAPRTDTAFGGV